ncbi:chemotaxis protein CheR [Pontibacter sp. BAB1700]|uniref:chemotaxis protein CheR n=1 Tax=Pontibacter sp. BAB1700 TaxID=1144253 RepID=UPI00026BC5D9|nr:chemotaxis protein CheR [Pontibacter sp. BAB1700]
MKLENEELFELEVEALIKEIHTQYGYDFSGYARASVYRRIKRFLAQKHLQSIDELRKFLFTDSFFFENFLQEVTVNVTEMFRDPTFFKSLRENVLPILSTYLSLRYGTRAVLQARNCFRWRYCWRRKGC